jgi:hypothetical protein
MGDTVARAADRFALDYWPWSLLAQPEPVPEATVPDQAISSAGAFTLRTAVVPHAALLGPPAPDNLACLVNDRLLHSGDSFDPGLGEFRGVEALALPVTAPWMTELDAAAFAERLAPRRVLPVHDGYVKDFFRLRRYEAFRGYLEKNRSDSRATWARRARSSCSPTAPLPQPGPLRG